MQIRASSLPKLALCGQYQSAPGEASEAAQRGTRIDGYMRHMWQTCEVPEGAEDEIQLAHWACTELLRLGDNHATRVAEAECRVYIPIIKYTGTMDAVNPRGLWLADLKSGQEHDYSAQMAAYALGCMVEHLTQTWTTHLLFCDSKRVVTKQWTLAEARDTVQAAFNNVGTPPALNDYCGWCAKSLTCEIRVDAAGRAMTATASLIPAAQDIGFLQMIENPERLGLFLWRAKVFDDFREAAEASAREMLTAGVDVPGWRLQKPRVSEFVDAADLVAAIETGQVGAADVVRAQGSISGRKARELWSAAGAEFPEHAVKTKTGAAPLVADKRK